MLTSRLRAIQWPPNFKVSNIDKYEPKQDPGGWLAVYTSVAQASGAPEDIVTAYLPIALGRTHYSGPDICLDTASMIGEISVVGLSRTSSPSLINRRNRGISTLKSIR